MYWERQKYKDLRWRSVFRNLVDHVVSLPIEEHKKLHEIYTGPKVPKDTLMIDTVEDYLDEHGQIDCVREHDTNSVYQIHPNEWMFIKGLWRAA